MTDEEQPEHSIVLDETPSGEEELAEQFSDPDKHKKLLENQSLSQDICERKTFADRAYAITKTWVGFLIILTFVQFFLKATGFGLSENEFMVVFSTTTGSVLVFWSLVGKYLFNTRSPDKD